MIEFAPGSLRCLNTPIYLVHFHRLLQEKSTSALLTQKKYLINPICRRRKVFDSPSAPARAANYNLLTELDM